MRIVGLTIFPVKSARGVPVASAVVEPHGFVGDRRWMIVDPNGRFVTQRELPALARLLPELTEAGLRLRINGETLDVPRPGAGDPRVPVRVWDDAIALPEAVAAGEWLSVRFGRTLRLVYQPDDALRPVSPDWGAAGDQVSLADGFPILIATTASLQALEDEAGMALDMARFRPNLVIETEEPWVEDRWAAIRIGEVELALPKPCARCSMTTVDPDLGEITGREPLQALRNIRFSGDRRVPGVLFGWNAVPRRTGAIAIGDRVEVLSLKEAWPLRSRAAAV